MFGIYFSEGVQHITDIQGYDHIAFLFALLAGYTIKDFKKVLILVTAFTIGHSITLALSSFNKILIDSALIEFLIPVTIFITAVYHLLTTDKKESTWVVYSFAFFFGLIHGAGFSNYFKSLMGKTASIIEPLLAFNLGVEVGQIIIVIVILALAYVFVHLFGLKKEWWRKLLGGLAAVIAVYLMVQTWPF